MAPGVPFSNPLPACPAQRTHALDNYTSPELFFLLGVARSGTTILSLLLDSHSAIAIPYESHFIVPYFDRTYAFDTPSDRITLVRSILQEPYVAQWDCPLTVDDVTLTNCTCLSATIREIFHAYARKRGKTLCGDKTPSYITEVDTLHTLFPHAKFIHVVRDGRDVATSLVKQWWGPNDFVSAIRYWERSVTLATKMLCMLPPSQTLMLRFEDLIDAPRTTLQRILAFLGVQFEEGMLSAYLSLASAKVGNRIHLHHNNLMRTLSPDQRGKWRRHMRHSDQAIAHEVAGALLNKLGYPRGKERSVLKPARKLYHYVRAAYVRRYVARTRPTTVLR